MAPKDPTRSPSPKGGPTTGFVIPPPPQSDRDPAKRSREQLPSPAIPRKTVDVDDTIVTEEAAAELVEAELVIDVDDVIVERADSPPPRASPRAVIPEEVGPLPAFGGVGASRLALGMGVYLGLQGLGLLSVYSLPLLAPVFLFFLMPFFAGLQAARFLRGGALVTIGLTLGLLWGLVQMLLMMRLIGSVALGGFRFEETGAVITSIAIVGNMVMTTLGLRSGAARVALREFFEAQERSSSPATDSVDS